MQERDGQKRLGREAAGDRGLQEGSQDKAYFPQWAQRGSQGPLASSSLSCKWQELKFKYIDKMNFKKWKHSENCRGRSWLLEA